MKVGQTCSALLGGGRGRGEFWLGLGWEVVNWKGHHLESNQATLVKRLKCSYCLNQEFNFYLSSPGVHKGLFLYRLQAKGGFCILKRLEDK